MASAIAPELIFNERVNKPVIASIEHEFITDQVRSQIFKYGFKFYQYIFEIFYNSAFCSHNGPPFEGGTRAAVHQKNLVDIHPAGKTHPPLLSHFRFTGNEREIITLTKK